MKKGKYRILVTQTTDVQITVFDLELFNQDYEAWKNLHADTVEDITEEDFLAARAIISVSGSTSEKYKRGLTIIHRHSDQEIEHARTCRHCGCTEYDACILSTGPCSWIAADVCSTPYCVVLETAQAEKEAHT